MPRDGALQSSLGASIVPPHSSEAEMGLLAALLVRNSAFEQVSDLLQPEHFAEGVHGRIYAAIAHTIGRGSRADPVTLKPLFDQDEALKDSGGGKYLTRLATSIVTVNGARDYARTIVDCWQRRQLIDAALETIAEASQTQLDHVAGELRERLESRLLAMGDAPGSGSNGPRTLTDFAADAIASADRAFRHQGKVTGVATGLSDLDQITGGLQPSDLIYLAGRPSMGKSALAGTIALNAARAGHPVYVATPEMSGEQVALRVLSIRSRISSQRIRSGQITPNDFQRMIDINAGELAALPVLVDDQGGISLATLRSRVRRFMLRAAKMPGAGLVDGRPATPLVVVDYIQLMSAAGKRREQNRNEDMSELSRGLKALAKEFGVPVLALSQLSRAVEARENKRPMLSDLRDSGSLEQDADVVAFIFREEYYVSREEPTRRSNETPAAWEGRFADWQAQLAQIRNTAEVLIAKQRHGPTGKALLRFDPETTSFDNLARGLSR